MQFITNKKILGLITTLGLVATFASCGSSNSPKPIDYAHNGSCVLQEDYEGSDFFTTGIGQFDLWMAIDGDTAHFTPKVTKTSNEIVKARFYGIDTPESTGRIQEYGKAASNFTKEKLKNAAEHGTIVLLGARVSETDHTPITEANGRYLSCVWINETVEHAPYDSLINLNLWIMQEGFSAAGSLDKMPEYADVFNKALMQAKNFKLNMYSGKPDPLYNYGEYEETDICDIMREAYASMDDPTHVNSYDGAKVRIRGTVSGYANNSLYIQKLDLDEGIYYGINIFCGMTKPHPRYLIPGTVLEVCADVTESENFGFQLTGAEGRFPKIESLAGDNDVKIITKAENNTNPETALMLFEETASSINSLVSSNNRKCVNSPVKINSDLTVNYFNVSNTGKITVGFAEADISVYLTEALAGDPNKPASTWTTREDWIGKRMRINFGVYVWHTTASGNTRYQVILQNSSDFVWLDALTEITLDKTEATVAPGGSLTLTAGKAPSTASLADAVWSSSDESIATVANGVVSVKSTATVGSTVTISLTHGKLSASCVITVGE